MMLRLSWLRRRRKQTKRENSRGMREITIMKLKTSGVFFFSLAELVRDI